MVINEKIKKLLIVRTKRLITTLKVNQ